MKLAALRDFLAVAERGSLRAAARARGGAQPTLSRSIRELEHEVGVALFERGSRGVQLTPMGQVFLRRAKAVQNELRLAQEELTQLRGEAHGKVTVALSSVAHIVVMPEVLRAFHEKYPEVRLDIIDSVFPGIEADLRSGAIDCYVGPVPPRIGKEFVVEKLFELRRVIVARKNHPLRQAKSLRELTLAGWITTSVTHRVEDELGPLFQEHRLPPPRLMMQAHSALTFLASLAYSDLLMFLPAQWVQCGLWPDTLTTIRVREKLTSPPISSVRRASLPLTPAAEYFSDLVRRAAKRVKVSAREI